jgi:hypothetical protein
MPEKENKELWVRVVKFSPAPSKVIRQIPCSTQKEADRKLEQALSNLIMMGWSDCAYVSIENERAPT